MKKTVLLSLFKIEVACFHERGLRDARSETANKICQEITRVMLRLQGGGWWELDWFNYTECWQKSILEWDVIIWDYHGRLKISRWMFDYPGHSFTVISWDLSCSVQINAKFSLIADKFFWNFCLEVDLTRPRHIVDHCSIISWRKSAWRRTKSSGTKPQESSWVQHRFCHWGWLTKYLFWHSHSHSHAQ